MGHFLTYWNTWVTFISSKEKSRAYSRWMSEPEKKINYSFKYNSIDLRRLRIPQIMLSHFYHS